MLGLSRSDQFCLGFCFRIIARIRRITAACRINFDIIDIANRIYAGLRAAEPNPHLGRIIVFPKLKAGQHHIIAGAANLRPNSKIMRRIILHRKLMPGVGDKVSVFRKIQSLPDFCTVLIVQDKKLLLAVIGQPQRKPRPVPALHTAVKNNHVIP